MGRSRKKGKSIGDKLARMSVEQRKQYLEKKAAQEEENVRRREELIGAFLKRKLSDEQRMGGFNEAKLNTKWRIILRQTKCTSLKVQLENLVLGTEEAAAAQDRLASVLRAQLQQTHIHRAAALNAHARTTNLLTGEHEEQLQSLTQYLRQQQGAILSASAHDLHDMCSHFLHQMYHLHLVLLAAKQEHQAHQKHESDTHVENMDLIAARQEDETAVQVAAKKAEVVKVQEEVVLLQQEQVQDVGVLQEECRTTQLKLDEVTKALRAAQSTVTKMQTELSASPEAETSTEGSSLARAELERLQQRAALLQAAAEAAESRNEVAIRAANARAAAATKRLESVVALGRSVLKTWSLCSKLQSNDDKLLPFLPADPRVEAAKSETGDLATYTPREQPLQGEVHGLKTALTFLSGNLHLKDSEAGRVLSSRSCPPVAPSDSGLGTSLVGTSGGDTFRPNASKCALPAVVETPAVSRLLADECAALSAADDLQQHQRSTAAQHDYTIVQAEDILRSHESVVRVHRQLQATKLQRSSLRVKEKQLRRQVEQLTQVLRQRIHSIGISDAAISAAANPPLQAKRILLKPEFESQINV